VFSVQDTEYVTIKNSASSDDISSSLHVWPVVVMLEVVSMSLGINKRPAGQFSQKCYKSIECFCLPIFVKISVDVSIPDQIEGSVDKRRKITIE